MTDRELMQQALDALDTCQDDYIFNGEGEQRVGYYDQTLIDAAAKRLRARLAQCDCDNPKQCWEPCGELGKSAEHAKPELNTCWCETCRPITFSDMRMVLCPTCGNKRCPHATDHRNECTRSNDPGQPGSSYGGLAQPELKPVAWMYEYGTDRCDAVNKIRWYPNVTAFRKPEGMVRNVVPLYTAPPRKEWQGLTDEDLSVCDEDGVILARYWEAKLKEKNSD